MAQLDWSQYPAVESIPGKVSGAWVFKNTRMPVQTIFENLEPGLSVKESSLPAAERCESGAPLKGPAKPHDARLSLRNARLFAGQLRYSRRQIQYGMIV